MNSAIILAAGKSTRMGAGTDKAFLPLGSKPIVVWSLLAFESCPDIDEIILVVRKDQMLAAKGVQTMFGISKLKKIVAGGNKRQDSVQCGLAEVSDDTRYVVVHDGARPCVTVELISEVLKCAKRSGCGIAAQRVVDTIKYVEKGMVVDHTVDREKLWAVQTPQAFSLALLTRAFKAVKDKGATVTDEASAVELLGEPVKLVEWTHPNLKITTVEDLSLAAVAMKLS